MHDNASGPLINRSRAVRNRPVHPIRTRSLTSDDLPILLHLKQQAGWNQLPADLARYIYLEPEGCFLAEWRGRPVGSACGFVFGPVAWIAMVLVEESLRGRGIGRALMERVLTFVDERGVATVRLDATAAGQPLYERLGFTTQYRLVRFQADQSPAQPVSSQVESLPDHRLAEVLDFDRQVTRTDREKLITRLYAESPGDFRVLRRDGSIRGYAAARPGSNARQIGPCLASDDAGPLLLADALTRARNQRVFVDVPMGHAAASQWLVARGFNAYREQARMCRGEPVLEDIQCLWASSGSEKG